jgi:apolipoprotein N-acyltransferase
MWQLQWLVGLIPDAILNWVYIGFITVGLTGMCAGWLGKYIPFYGNYVQILKPVGIVLLLIGVYFKGGYNTEMSWRAKVADLEAKVKVANEKSTQANKDLDQAVKAKTKTIKEVQVVIKERIKEVEKRIDADCKVDREALDILNDSARNQKGRK